MISIGKIKKNFILLSKIFNKLIPLNFFQIVSIKIFKNFLKNVDFSTPSIMGILNLTPDSFSDGGKFNNKNRK